MDWKAGVRFPAKERNFFSPPQRPAMGPSQPHIQWEPGALSPGIKEAGCEADY
jgi:hypothetical protein